MVSNNYYSVVSLNRCRHRHDSFLCSQSTSNILYHIMIQTCVWSKFTVLNHFNSINMMRSILYVIGDDLWIWNDVCDTDGETSSSGWHEQTDSDCVRYDHRHTIYVQITDGLKTFDVSIHIRTTWFNHILLQLKKYSTIKNKEVKTIYSIRTIYSVKNDTLMSIKNRLVNNNDTLNTNHNSSST